MNKEKLLQIGLSNDDVVWAYSLIRSSFNPHCVLVLIEYRINLLRLVPTNRIVLYIINKIEQTFPLILRESTEQRGSIA